MPDVELRADCEKCAALCCVALAFDKGAHFGFDKANGEVCSNLSALGQCSIHPELANRGFGGCVRYDCLGAGQRVTQELFAGQTWQEDPTLLEPMLLAFQGMARIHELLVLLGEAQKLDLPPSKNQQLEQLLQKLSPQNGWSIEGLETSDLDGVFAEIRGFLQSLKKYVV